MSLNRRIKVTEVENKLILHPNQKRAKLQYLLFPLICLLLILPLNGFLFWILIEKKFQLNNLDHIIIWGIPVVAYLISAMLMTQIPRMNKGLKAAPLVYVGLASLIGITVFIIGYTIINVDFLGAAILGLNYLNLVRKADLIYLIMVNHFSIVIFMSLVWLALTVHSSIVLEKSEDDIFGFSSSGYFIPPFMKMELTLTFRSVEKQTMRFTIFVLKRIQSSLLEGSMIVTITSHTLNELFYVEESKNTAFMLLLPYPIEGQKLVKGAQVLTTQKKEEILELVDRISDFCRLDIVKLPDEAIKTGEYGSFQKIPITEDTPTVEIPKKFKMNYWHWF